MNHKWEYHGNLNPIYYHVYNDLPFNSADCQKGGLHWSLAGEFAGVELGDRNRALESGGLERALGISIMVNND
jgi:hypothetical protein